MGLIRAMGGAVGGTLADQWKEYFYCEAMDADVLVCKGQKRVSGRSSNTKGSDNIITNGSCVIIRQSIYFSPYLSSFYFLFCRIFAVLLHNCYILF